MAYVKVLTSQIYTKCFSIGMLWMLWIEKIIYFYGMNKQYLMHGKLPYVNAWATWEVEKSIIHALCYES
jgi:hypothetical protein